MRVFITGGAGWIGTAVIAELLSHGHKVTALARSDTSAEILDAVNLQVVRGDARDSDLLSRLSAESDGVIHLAFDHDFTRFETSVLEEARAIKTLGDSMAGTSKPLVVASGTPMTPGRPSTELDLGESEGPAAARSGNTLSAVAFADQNIRSSVVRLPRTTHGEGERNGFIATLVNITRQRGEAPYVGDGENRWPTVHVHDAAKLFRKALEHAPAGSVLHAVGEDGVPVRQIAEAIARKTGTTARPIPAEELGFLGAILAGDQPSSSAHTQALLNWQPTARTLLEDLAMNHYFQPTKTARTGT